MHIEEGKLDKPDWVDVMSYGVLSGRQLEHTKEERYHLRRRDSFRLGDAIWHFGKGWPYGSDHDLHHIAAIDGLDGKPKHSKDDP